MSKKDIRSFSLEELLEIFKANQQEKYRAKQVFHWLWKKSATSFEEMTNLPKPLRSFLTKEFSINAVTLGETQISTDRTIKSIFQLHDGRAVEGVLIPTEKRMTACISSQIGCSLSCSFCATGKMKRLRNLGADEMYDQVVLIRKLAEDQYKKPLTNIVYMGMGEPLLNYKNVLASVDKICEEHGLGMSPKRITVSTAGIAKMITKLGEDQVKFNLALSLHAADDEKRTKIMPINEQNSLKSLYHALRHYYDKTGLKITFEYTLLKGFNDTPEDAKKLAKFCKQLPSKVNLIEYNPIDDGLFEKSDAKTSDAFSAALNAEGIVAKIRRSRGKDIDAACGQLANKNHKTQQNL